MTKSIQFTLPDIAKTLLLLGAIILINGCCALPDIPGPIGIPGC